MATYNKFNQFVADVANKIHNLGSDTLKVALSNVAPVATNTIFANITEISAGNGYTAGGIAPGLTSSAQTSGLYKLIIPSITWTATGAIGPFRYAVFYNSSAASSNLIAWFDYGSSITLASGDTFSITFDAVNGILQLQ